MFILSNEIVNHSVIYEIYLNSIGTRTYYYYTLCDPDDKMLRLKDDVGREIKKYSFLTSGIIFSVKKKMVYHRYKVILSYNILYRVPTYI